MRWFIEVSSGNPTGPAEQWVVEAAQWQPALQAARALRGESVETGGFSIELLEDGFRVIDPATLVRYVVRRAPDATPLSVAPGPKSVAAGSAIQNNAAKEAPAPTTAPSAAVAPPAANGGSAAPTAPKSIAPPAAARPPSTAPRAATAAGTTPPGAGAPAADMSGMTQAERIAAMLSVDATPQGSSRAPRSPSTGPKSGGPKGSPRSVPATSSRNGGQASRPAAPAEGAPPSPSTAVLRAPQGAALRAPRAAAVAVPEPPRPLAHEPSSAPVIEAAVAEAAVAEAAIAVAAAVEPAQPVHVVPAAPPAAQITSSPSQPPPPRLITQPPAAPVVQSLNELQALVHPNAPPRPVSQPPPAPAAQMAPPHASAAQASAPAAPTAQVSQPAAPAAQVSAPPAPAVAQVAQAPAADGRVAPSEHSPSSPPESLPFAELLFQRSEDPSASSPLTYREAAWAVPEGTTIAAAVRLLAGMFEGVRAALAGVKPGKLVYMAIFDHRFVGKPTRPPLATLTWKDWKDQGQGPEIRRQGEPRTSFQPPSISNSFIPAAVPQPPGTPHIDASVPSGVAPLSVAPAQVAAPGATAVPSVIVAPEAAAVPAAPQVAAPTPAPLPGFAQVPPQGAAMPAQAIPNAADAQSAAALVGTPAAAPMAAAPVAHPSAPSSGAGAPPMLVVVPEPVTPLPAPAPAVSRAAAPSTPAVRQAGVDLIADLFECMHDLHFLPDALAGADFVLGLMLDKLPSAVALVHFYDIDAREFVVVRAVGVGAAKVMRLRTSEKEPLIAEAMHKRRAVVVDDAAADPRAHNGRWALIGEPPRSLVCAPVEEGGRFLGLLELSNPLDGQPFREGDGHAITYIGEQFAEFLAERGVVLDPERIGE